MTTHTLGARIMSWQLKKHTGFKVLSCEIFEEMTQETVAFHGTFKYSIDNSVNITFSAENDGQGGSHNYEPINGDQRGLTAFINIMNENLASQTFEAFGMTLSMTLDLTISQLVCDNQSDSLQEL